MTAAGACWLEERKSRFPSGMTTKKGEGKSEKQIPFGNDNQDGNN